VTTELLLLGTAAAPMPVAGRRGIASALVVDDRIFIIDCGRGAPSAFVDMGLDFTRLEAILITHLHADHTGDLPGMLLYPWGVRTGGVEPIRVFGPGRPNALPSGDGAFHRQTTIHPELPGPGTSDLVCHILAGYAYHLNVMPLDAMMPDAGSLVSATDIIFTPASAEDHPTPVVVLEDAAVQITAMPVTHGRAAPAFAYRFDTNDGSVVFSGDTTVNRDLIRLAHGATVLVHCVADLAYLQRHGMDDSELSRMAALHTDVTEVGAVAERAGVGELILTHYLPSEPEAISTREWARRAGQRFSGRTTAGTDGLRRNVSAAASLTPPR
jgi:ribonuclease BN (tRNA processing enzyme)